MINEEIYDLTGGIRSRAEKLAYQYAQVSRSYQMPNLFEPMRVLQQREFIEQYSRGENPFPKSIEIDPTNFCNHDCPFCIYSSLHKEHHKERIPNDKLFSLLHECHELGVESALLIGGGEPLAHTKTVSAIKYGNELGLSMGLVTNGSLIKPQDFETLRMHATYVRVSLDSGSPESHHILHGSTDFNHVIENIQKLSEKPRKVTVGVSFFVNEVNVHETVKTVRLVKSLGVDYIQIKTYAGIGIPDEWYEILLDEIESSLTEATPEFSIYIMDNIFNRNQYQVRDYRQCHWQAFKTIIGADGDVYLCTQKRGKKDASIGNINQSSLSEIWQSRHRKDVVQGVCLKDCPYCVHHTQNSIIDFLSSTTSYHSKFY